MFDFFKKKDSEKSQNEKGKEACEIPSNWQHHYIYGFINGNPFQTIKNVDIVSNILRNTVGKKGFIGIDSIFHPYNLVNEKGATAWDLAWFRTYLPDNGKFLKEISQNKAGTVIKTESLNLKDNYRIWPNDSLDPKKNKQYARFVPFVLPFMIYKNNDELHYNWMIKEEMKLQGHANTYMENFNKALSEYTNGHIMTLGFGEFDRENLDDLIEKFTNFYEKNLKQL